MMKPAWIQFLKYDPLPALSKISCPALRFFIDRDIFDLDPGAPSTLWTDPDAVRIMKKQKPQGFWPDGNPRKHLNSHTNYALLETYRNLRVLVDIFGMDCTHPAVQNAVKFIFRAQTEEGDFRGIYGKQYSPNYTAGLLELIVKSGFHQDIRVDKAFQWFLRIQQTEGGWTIPMQTWQKKARDWDEYVDQEVLPFQAEKPFSHFVTGIVLRAFANHPAYSRHPEALKAGELITSRFFKEDKYTSYKSSRCWTRYTFPFWWNDLIAVLDALARMGFTNAHEGIRRALNYYHDTQKSTGLWDFSMLQSKSLPEISNWLNFRLCWILKRMMQDVPDLREQE